MGEMFAQSKTELGLDTARLWRCVICGVIILGIALAVWAALGDEVFAGIIGAGVVSLIVWDALRQRKRTEALRAMAVRRGFVYLGKVLPRALTLRGTPFKRASLVWNVIEGYCGGIRVVAFDCRIASGKGSWRRTAIAAQSARDVFGAVRFDRDLTVDRSGDWGVLYQPKTLSLPPPGLMPVPEIEAHLESIGR